MREDLVAFLDGELGVERARAIEAHLSGCSACAAEAEQLRCVWDALDVLDVDAPAGADWLKRIEAEIRPPSRRVVPWPWVAAAAALLMALGVAIGSGGFSAEDPDAPVAVQPGGSPVESPRGQSPAPQRSPELAASTTPEPRRSPVASPEQSWPDEPRRLAELSAEEREVIENLEILEYLRQQEELDVLHALDLLQEMDETELEEEAG